MTQLIFDLSHEKVYIMLNVNKGIDRPAHIYSLNRDFDVCCSNLFVLCL